MKLIITNEKEHTKLPEIMRAAIHLFVRQGIDGTTTKDIAKEAGVAEGALYRHFKSKNDLAWALFSKSLKAFTADLIARVYPLKTARERILEFVTASFEAYEEDPELYSYLILREHSELGRYAQTGAHPGDVVLKIIKDGQKAGEVRDGDSMLLGSMSVGGVIRVCVVKMYGELKGSLPARTREVADMIWRMVKR